ncbi:MAG: hypothetical protein HC814_00740 [Rhodobacteraceae bacterium]|nr:hypothetical protein [Paracoccaceae bacterium]
MKIDAVTGSIAFAAGTIDPRADKRAFLTSPVGNEAQCALESAGYAHLHFGPEPGIRANALFKGEYLDRIFLQMTRASIDAKEWTESRELERKAFHDEWLRQELGEPPYDYPWGQVVSEYDAKGMRE